MDKVCEYQIFLKGFDFDMLEEDVRFVIEERFFVVKVKKVYIF